MAETFEALCQDVRRLLGQKEYVQAVALTSKLSIRYPNSAEAHFLVARALVESGDMQNALVPAERAAAIEANNFQYVFYCGYLYLHFRLYELALPFLKKSVQLQPNAPVSQVELADCYYEIGKGDIALQHYRAALKLETESYAKNSIRLKLALCLIASRQKSEARPIIMRLLKEAKEYSYPALSLLAQIENATPDNTVGELISKAIADPTIEATQREVLLLSFGKLQENAKNYDGAFASWQESRDSVKSRDYNLRNHAEVLLENKQFYSPELFKSSKEFAIQTEVPVFIAGMPRSGTTLTEQILSAHSKANGVGELARWTQLDRALRQDYQMPNYISKFLENAKNGELKARGLELLKIFALVAPEQKPRTVEKTPHNFLTLGYLHLICPRAKFIHIRRHPADTFISTFQNHFNDAHGYAYDQVEYAKEYLFHEDMMNLWKSLFPENIITINYESLASQPEPVVRKMLAFLGLDWEDQTLRFFESSKTVRTFSMHQVRNPVNTASLDRWRNYERHLGSLLSTLKAANFDYIIPET